MQIEKMTYVTVHGSREGKFMTIPSANNNLAKVISSNPVFSAQKQKKGLSLPTKNGQIRQDNGGLFPAAGRVFNRRRI